MATDLAYLKHMTEKKKRQEWHYAMFFNSGEPTAAEKGCPGPASIPDAGAYAPALTGWAPEQALLETCMAQPQFLTQGPIVGQLWGSCGVSVGVDGLGQRHVIT